MKLRFVLAIVSLVLSLAISADNRSIACAGCWQPVSHQPTVEESLGVNIHFTDSKPGEMKMIADAGFSWVRMDFKWDATESERGRYDFSAYDRLLKELEANGLRTLFILDYGNSAYGEGAPRTEAARQAFSKWAVAAARHFSNRGVLWEIYNEPNNAAFWRPVSANDYSLLANAVAQAFREAVPNEKLIGPAVGEMDFAFLDSCFKTGALDSFTAVSVHPYLRTNPELVANDYARLRGMIEHYTKVRDDQDRSELPIISGEWGYSSAWRGMNETKQAEMVARQFLTNMANGIPISIWYDWRDDGTDPNEAEHHFGLVRYEYRNGSRSVYEPKPAFLAARTLTTVLRGFRFQERLNVGTADDYVLVFGKEGERRIVAWTTLPTPHRLTIPGQAGQFSVLDMLGNDAGQLSATQDALTINVSASPIYLFQSH